MANIIADIPSVEVRDYTVQYHSKYSGWMDCVVYMDETGNRVPFIESTGVQASAVFQDVTEAEAHMNKLRDAHPTVLYRMTRKLIITEVVHA